MFLLVPAHPDKGPLNSCVITEFYNEGHTHLDGYLVIQIQFRSCQLVFLGSLSYTGILK